MSAQILYFPNNNITYQPSPQDYPLTITQLECMKSHIQRASHFFEENNELITKHLHNKLRITFHVQRLEDIPRQHYDESLNLIEQARKEIFDFRLLIRDLQKQFADKILRDGDPWTTATKAQWRKKLARQLPERPDWRALAVEIEKMK